MTRAPKEVVASEILREHLVRVLQEQIERTFNLDGQAAGMHLVADLLGRLDDRALRELAYQRGLTTEFDLEPDEVDRRE